jgi:hypothetical protein
MSSGKFVARTLSMSIVDVSSHYELFVGALIVFRGVICIAVG